MIYHACAIRQTAATGVHDASSRSHAILRFSGLGAGGWGAGGEEEEGVLTLVDLAGSEHRIDSMHHTEQRRKEGSQINASLMALKTILSAKGRGKAIQHVYRRSKLTMCLKSSFVMHGARTAVIATISPAAKDTEHSLNTLRHACIMDGQKGKGKGKGAKGKGGRAAASFITGGKSRREELGEINVREEAMGMRKGKGGPVMSNGNEMSQQALANERRRAGSFGQGHDPDAIGNRTTNRLKSPPSLPPSLLFSLLLVALFTPHPPPSLPPPPQAGAAARWQRPRWRRR
jgi:hypothetical protein